MGIVNDKDFEREIKNSSVPVGESITRRPTTVITPPPVKRGRKAGDVNVPNSIRNLLGSVAHTDGRTEALEVARDLGISPSSVAAYSNGATSTASYDKRVNEPVVDLAKQRVSKRARGKLMMALNHLTDEKMGEAKAIELSSIARNMGAIIKDMEPPVKDTIPIDMRPQFVVFAPTINNETNYETIVAKE